MIYIGEERNSFSLPLGSSTSPHSKPDGKAFAFSQRQGDPSEDRDALLTPQLCSLSGDQTVAAKPFCFCAFNDRALLSGDRGWQLSFL